ncbi:TRAP transporter substrate-binding protein [Cytobacillus praedii]|uniref:TRAP transporter substrate-binding protein n=1 Tax=Cytobacillus praedii TaxID=1742358 RepID=UPI002E1EA1D4|nr:TRAP transporter substrate-binding protein [Cytobacillus praedii]
MSKWVRIISLCAILTLILFAAGCGNSKEKTTGSSSGNKSGEKQTFKLAHITPTDHMWHKAAEKFGEELKSRSDGRLELEIYPASQLGTEADMVQQIESGSIDFGLITAAYLSARAPEFAAWFMPYGFTTLEEANEARKSNISKKILSSLEEQGLKGLDYLFAGQRVMIFKDKQVKTPADMNGLKLRVTPSPPMQDFYRSTGAAPEGLPLPEVYAAIQTGVIDGMDMDLDATITNKYYEVAKYGAVTNHMVWPSVVIANQSKFEGMPEEDRKIVTDSLEAAIEFAVTTRSAQEEEFKNELSENGMEIYEISPKEFKKQIDEFDQIYSEKSPLIKEFIKTYRK